jgi:hypothetical protein
MRSQASTISSSTAAALGSVLLQLARRLGVTSPPS